MATVKIEIPDFNFAGFYYPAIYESLIQHKRDNCPELTDESQHEPSNMLLSGFALVGHLNTVQIDMTAKESLLRTAELAESVREHLRLIGYEMKSASPAKATIIYELSKVVTTTTTIVNEGAGCATVGSDSIYFEADEDLVIERSDQFTHVLAYENGAYTNYTSKANSTNHPADDWIPWSSPEINDAIYFGHTGVMWNRVKTSTTVAGSGMSGVWEYYDGDFEKSTPDSVSNLGIVLEFECNGYLGTGNRTGLTVRVSLNATKANEDAIVTFDGVTNKVQVGLLGQAMPSTNPEDYTIGSDWELIIDDPMITPVNTSNDAIFDLPQTTSLHWENGEVNGISAFWLRWRITEIAGPTSPEMRQVTMHEGKQYVAGEVTQGRTQVDNPLGSGDGTANQRYKVTQDNVIDGSFEVSVDGVQWDLVANFLETESADEVYRIELGENDSATVVFAPIGQGKAPPVGVNNIAVAYRYKADQDGNVGAGTINVDKSGLTLVNRLYNPRQAFGWAEAQGASAASLEKAKQLGPASLRTLTGVAISADDVTTLTLNFVNEDGSKPFSRAFSVEELFGPKTIGLILVASGGGGASSLIQQEVETYFNGDKFAIPPISKHLVSNQTVKCINYDAVAINVTATVTAPKSITAQQIVNALNVLLDPEALKEDGSWLWEFGGTIPESRIHAVIHGINPTLISKVVLTGWSDVLLGASQLPVAGAISIEVVQ